MKSTLAGWYVFFCLVLAMVSFSSAAEQEMRKSDPRHAKAARHVAQKAHCETAKDKKEAADEDKDDDEEGDEEEAITLDKAPAEVQAAVKKALGGNKLEKLTKEEEEKDGKEVVIYEAEFSDHGAKHTISMDKTGKIVEDEQEIEVSKLPEAVTKAVMAAHAGAKISKAEIAKAGDKTTYEVVIGEGKMTRELKVSPEGKVLEDEAKHEKKHEHEDKDDDEKEEHEKSKKD
jgi:hypothetical protein